MTSLLLGGLGTPELILILLVVTLLFGASKLPDLARGSGRALRIFKDETKGLMNDDEAKGDSHHLVELAAKQTELDARQAELDRQRERLMRDQL